jgi:hypothetical protein
MHPTTIKIVLMQKSKYFIVDTARCTQRQVMHAIRHSHMPLKHLYAEEQILHTQPMVFGVYASTQSEPSNAIWSLASALPKFSIFGKSARAVGCWYAHALPKSARGSRFSALGLMWHPLVGKKHYRILLAPFHGALGGPYNPQFLVYGYSNANME